MIGRALSSHLRTLGYQVVTVSRHPVPGGILWDPARGTIDAAGLAGIRAVINLAGESIAEGRWTDSRKRLLVESRVSATRLLAETLAQISSPPDVLISTSAMGIYGDRGEEILTEDAAPAMDFLAQLATEWEAAAEPARAAGIRVVHPRFGIVLTPEAGALAKLLPTARLGLGGPIGNGNQWWSWIALSDLVSMVEFLLNRTQIAGAVNAVSPNPVRQREFATTLGAVLHRPACVPIPAMVMRLALGEMADSALLASTRVMPKRMMDAGFQFEFPKLTGAFQAMLTR
jgi:uncharacterized protein (TIGR01777 family)